MGVEDESDKKKEIRVDEDYREEERKERKERRKGRKKRYEKRRGAGRVSTSPSFSRRSKERHGRTREKERKAKVPFVARSSEPARLTVAKVVGIG